MVLRLLAERKRGEISDDHDKQGNDGAGDHDFLAIA